MIPFKAVHLLGLRGILNADLGTLGALGSPEGWANWKILEQYPSFTVIHPNKGRLFCFGLFDRADGLREAWTVVTAHAPVKLLFKTLRLAIRLYGPQVATITGRTPDEFEVCERFLNSLGFTVPMEGGLPTLARGGMV
jgi:hypothetical protein